MVELSPEEAEHLGYLQIELEEESRTGGLMMFKNYSRSSIKSVNNFCACFISKIEVVALNVLR